MSLISIDRRKDEDGRACEDCGCLITLEFDDECYIFTVCENCYRVYIIDDIEPDRWIYCSWTLFSHDNPALHKPTENGTMGAWLDPLLEELTNGNVYK